MQGKKLSLFIDALYINPEMEFEYAGNKYLASGYRDDNNEYLLRVDTIEASSCQIFFVQNEDVQKCVEAFEQARLFDGRTIYETHDEITIIYG